MLEYKPAAGESLFICVQNTIKLAYKNQQEVEFVFNGIRVRVQPTSHEYDIAEIWGLKRRIQQGDY